MAKTKKKPKSRNLFVRLIALMIAVIALFALIFVAVIELTPFDAQKLTQTSQPSIVYAGDGSAYMNINQKGSGGLTYEQMPKNLTDAIVAIEDHNFWNSSSIDVHGLLRAGFVDLWSKSYAQGASTIQEQLAKIVYLNDKKTMTRKVQQIALGVQINRHFTKQEILSMYLNKVYLGENCVGVRDAASRYFGIDLAKHPEQLTLEDAALLAGLPQAPSAYDPIPAKNRTLALQRRNMVLEAMAKYSYITEAQAKAAEAKPIKVSYHSLSGDSWETNPLFYNFLLDYAKREANIPPEELLQGGLKIYTTVNPKVQSAINTVFWSTNYNNDFPGPTTGTVVQGAALFVDPNTGGILGGAGSRKQGFAYQGEDRIFDASSPGSSIKPVLEYGAAVDSGNWSPSSILNNTPQDFGRGFMPRNDDPGAPGRMTMADALATSQNVAAVWLLKQIGINTGADFAQRLGIPLTSDDRNHLGIAIGGLDNGVSTYDMARAYEAFANKGVQSDTHLITKIQNMAGDTIYEYQPAAKRVMSEQTAATMTQMLMGVVQRGTGTAAQVPGWDVAGKTGTVQYDSALQGSHQGWLSRGWFDGYTPSLCGSIYIGYDKTDAQHHLEGPYFASYYAAKLFGDITSLAVQGQTPQHFNVSAPPAQTQQPPVTNLQAAWDATINALQLTWQSGVAGQANFVVKRSGPTGSGQSGTGSTVTLGQTNQTSFEDTSVQPGMTYTYVVQALDSNSGAPLTPAQSITVTIQSSAPPAAPPDNTAGNSTGNSTGTDGGTGPGNTVVPPVNSTGGTGGTGTGGTGTGTGGTGTGNGTGGTSNSTGGKH